MRIGFPRVHFSKKQTLGKSYYNKTLIHKSKSPIFIYNRFLTIFAEINIPKQNSFSHILILIFIQLVSNINSCVAQIINYTHFTVYKCFLLKFG